MTQSQPEQTMPFQTALGTGIRIGLIGGIVAVIIALQGMIQAFSNRDVISGVVSLSQMLILLTFFGSGYAAIHRGKFTQLAQALIAGATAGILSCLLLIALIVLGGLIPLGDMFVNATAQLYDLLTFKQGLFNGSLILLALSAVLGAIPALVNLLPSDVRRSVWIGLVSVLTFGVLQDLIRVTFSSWGAFTLILKFLYTANGLTIAGAVVLFLVIGVLAYGWRSQGSKISETLHALPTQTFRYVRWGSLSVGSIFLLLLPVFLGLYLSEVIDNVGLYVMMGLGLNIVIGFAGLLDLGYVAFWAIGAYTVGVLTSPELRTGVIQSWWIALPFAVVMAVCAGVLLGIPVLKMRGDYLAIVTLGFGEIIRLLVLSDFLKPYLGGSQGIQLIAKPDIGPIQFGVMQFTLPIIGPVQYGVPQQFYYVILAGCLLAAFVATRVKSSRLGRAWMAIREDEDVAQAMGIELVTTKLTAFAMGAAFGGLSGAIFASKIGSAYASSFNFLVSINVLSLIIIGGMGSIPGVILGAFALVGLPELLREFADYRYLLYGVVLVVMMLVRPEGLLPEARRAAELEEFRKEDVVPEVTSESTA